MVAKPAWFAGLHMGLAWSLLDGLSLAIGPSLAVVTIGMIIRGMGGSINWTFSTVLIQGKVPNQMLGRVFGLDFMAFQLGLSLAVLAPGIIMDVTDISPQNLGNVCLYWQFSADDALDQSVTDFSPGTSPCRRLTVNPHNRNFVRLDRVARRPTIYCGYALPPEKRNSGAPRYSCHISATHPSGMNAPVCRPRLSYRGSFRTYRGYHPPAYPGLAQCRYS